MRRRVFLKSSAGAAVVSLAACGGGGADEDEAARQEAERRRIRTPAPTPAPTLAPTPTPTPAPTTAPTPTPTSAPTPAPTPTPTPTQAPTPAPTSTPAPTPAPAAGTYFVDFTAAAAQDPLSLGGTWSNNTQSVDGNVAPLNLSSMRIAPATNGIRIAQHAAADVGTSYADSFAFLPNFSTGNMRVTAVVYRDPNYQPSANHELEIILGCATMSGGNHRWIECLWSSTGGTAILSLSGQPGDYRHVGANVNSIDGPRDNDVWVAELNRSAGTVKWWVNGVLACQSSSALVSGGEYPLGNGAGIAAFRRPGDTNSAAMGFKSFKCERF